MIKIHKLITIIINIIIIIINLMQFIEKIQFYALSLLLIGCASFFIKFIRLSCKNFAMTDRYQPHEFTFQENSSAACAKFLFNFTR